MRPRERRETGEQDLFRSRLDQIIDMEHVLVKLARTIDWGFLEASFCAVTNPNCRVSHGLLGGIDVRTGSTVKKLQSYSSLRSWSPPPGSPAIAFAAVLRPRAGEAGADVVHVDDLVEP